MVTQNKMNIFLKGMFFLLNFVKVIICQIKFIFEILVFFINLVQMIIDLFNNLSLVFNFVLHIFIVLP